nr:Pr6Pr family membrane protein [Flexivirga oryzae]
MVRVHAALRLALAALIAVTVVVQLVEALGREDNPATLGNFFSYFTIQSNIVIAVVAAIAGLIQLRGPDPQWLDRARGAATVYISITGVVYALLLSNIDVNTPVSWVNVVLHYFVPIAAVVDWLVDLPERVIGFRAALSWLGYPVLYLVYTLIRGSIVDWYPYPFLNPHPHGYGYVAIMSVFVAIMAALFTAVVSGATRLPGRMVRRPD